MTKLRHVVLCKKLPYSISKDWSDGVLSTGLLLRNNILNLPLSRGNLEVCKPLAELYNCKRYAGKMVFKAFAGIFSGRVKIFKF